MKLNMKNFEAFQNIQKCLDGKYDIMKNNPSALNDEVTSCFSNAGMLFDSYDEICKEVILESYAHLVNEPWSGSYLDANGGYHNFHNYMAKTNIELCIYTNCEANACE